MYYGYTQDLEKRLDYHRINKENFHLIYYEAYKFEIDARHRERRLKNYSQALSALKSRLAESLK